MVNISKEDAEFLAGFIDQWLPVCGEKTAERARAVKERLTSAASINQERGSELATPDSEDDEWARSL